MSDRFDEKAREIMIGQGSRNVPAHLRIPTVTLIATALREAAAEGAKEMRELAADACWGAMKVWTPEETAGMNAAFERADMQGKYTERQFAVGGVALRHARLRVLEIPVTYLPSEE